jgi:hypothetical protein
MLLFPFTKSRKYSTPASQKIYIEEKKCSLTLLQGVCQNLKVFSLYIHPHQIRSTNCKDTKQNSYKNEQHVFLRGAMRYGGVLWLENWQKLQNYY